MIHCLSDTSGHKSELKKFKDQSFWFLALGPEGEHVPHQSSTDASGNIHINYVAKVVGEFW